MSARYPPIVTSGHPAEILRISVRSALIWGWDMGLGMRLGYGTGIRDWYMGLGMRYGTTSIVNILQGNYEPVE